MSKEKATHPQVRVTLVKSFIRREKYQEQCVRGLGLRKLHQTRVLEDTPSVRGMINQVKHLLKVEAPAGTS